MMKKTQFHHSVSLLQFILTELKYLTVFRLIVSFFWFFCAFSLMDWTGLSGVGALLVNLCGLFLGMLISWIVIYGRARMLPFPACRSGKCSHFDDYSWQEGSFYGCSSFNVYMYKCHCGDCYLRNGDQFMELHEDGTTKPYKILVKGRGWVDEE